MKTDLGCLYSTSTMGPDLCWGLGYYYCANKVTEGHRQEECRRTFSRARKGKVLPAERMAAIPDLAVRLPSFNPDVARPFKEIVAHDVFLNTERNT